MTTKSKTKTRPGRITPRAKLTANVLALVGEWQAYRSRTRESVNGAMATLLGRVDWDHLKPADLRATFGTLLAGLPLADLQDLVDVADSERQILASCAADQTSTAHDRLSESDAWLIFYAVKAGERHGDNFIQEVRELPRATRAAVSALLTELECPEGPGPHANRGKLQERLVSTVLAGGGPQSLADAFVLSSKEWRLRHVQRASSLYGVKGDE